MSSKLLLFLIGLVAISAIEAKISLKKFHSKDISTNFFSKHGENVNTLLRKRRSIEDNAEAKDNTSESVSLESQEAIDLAKFFMAELWQTSKVEVLSEFLNELSDFDTNLTLIGWQRVFDEEGKITQIRTIQLVIPPKPDDDGATNAVPEDDDVDYLDEEGNKRFLPYREIKEMEERFNPLRSMGISASVSMEQFKEDGEREMLIYIDKDELYFNADGFSIYNKTDVASYQEISDFIKNLKPGTLGKPSILKYDVDGNFLAELSDIKPHLLGSVISHYQAPENILLASPQIIAQISQQYSKETIPKKLAAEYTKRFPEYRWRVLVNPSTQSVTKDVAVKLAYDNFDLDENSFTNYFVYGVKKQN